MSASYARTIYGNFSVTDNLNLAQSDYDPYCVTLPADSRLARGGQQLCGLWDQRANVATSNFVAFADDYIDKYPLGGLEQSRQTEYFNGFDLDVCRTLREAGCSTPGGAWATPFRTPPSLPTAGS